ncbi:hypothetical protein OLMES_3018 [Oleiphilus messinensis]|uniref:DUF445 domain-containing protein n=1 Tax=Oleiphilus messinensis TaxID=141451 RepID=A0A1Y0I9B8_9GAMM|nr:hypothetical protein [Oleiphilus messinensis]ARU57061.1 hypothetical protein OLMES_3018 [Oleiphilus messinensis]
MEFNLTAVLNHPNLYQLLSIPVIAAIVGWTTNWLAIKLTFFPLNFIGIGKLGWQGIIPRKSAKMAAISVDRTVARFGNLQDVFLKLEPEKITRHIIEQTDPRLEEYIDEIMYEKHAVLWENLPYTVREKVYAWARKQLPKRIEALVADFGEELSDLVDLKELFVGELKNNRELMVRIFKEAGDAEFDFIVKSGAWWGVLFGLIMVPLWVNYPTNWLLPLGGFFIGFLTNWLALNVIFRPLNPRYLLGFKIQGMFLRRQSDVSKVWSRLVAEELITVEKVARSMVFGNNADRTRSIIQKHIRPALDQAGILRLVTQLSFGTTGYAELKKALQEKAIEVSTEPFHDVTFNQSRAPIVASVIEQRMSALSPREFQDVLRPAFQEEEWQLMLIGGVLGAVAGLLNWLIFF